MNTEQNTTAANEGTSKADRELVVKAFALFLEFGALSAERLFLFLTESHYSMRDVHWVLNQLSAEKNSLELYTLPESATPKNWR